MAILDLSRSIISCIPNLSNLTSGKSLLPKKKNKITHIIKTNTEFVNLLYQVLSHTYIKWIKMPSFKHSNYE